MRHAFYVAALNRHSLFGRAKRSRGRCSYRVHLIPDSCFGFFAQLSHAFHPCVANELVSDLHRKGELLTCLTNASQCIGQTSAQMRPSLEVIECMAHPKLKDKDRVEPAIGYQFIAFHFQKADIKNWVYNTGFKKTKSSITQQSNETNHKANNRCFWVVGSK